MSELKKFLELYQKYGFVAVPLSKFTKVPVQGFNLEGVYNTGQVEYDWDKHEGNLGIVSGFNDLLIIDCDSPEAITWLEAQEEFIPTVTVKTRRGHHYWYKLHNIPEGFEGRTVKLSDADGVFKIEFLFGRRYAVAPPSVVKNEGVIYKYVFINGYDVSKHELQLSLLDFETYQKFLRKAYKRAGKEYETERVRTNVQAYVEKVGDEKKLSKFLQIVELCKKYYVKGLRQTIWLGLAGLGRRLYLPRDVVEEILKRELYEGMRDDDRYKQRLSAIEETYEKEVNEVAGIGILTRDVFNEEDARTASFILGRFGKSSLPGVPVLTEDDLGRAQEIIKHGNRVFALIENDWYMLIDEGKSKDEEERKPKKLKPICGAFLLKDRGFKPNLNEPVYIVYNCETRRTGKIRLDLHELQNFLARPILDGGNLRFLLDALIRNHREKLFLQEIGWYRMGSKRLFVHPLNQSSLIENGLYCDLDSKEVEHFKYVNASKQHELVRELLVEGRWLGVKIVLGVASLFIEDNLSGFTVFDVGPRGVGKTTTSQFVMSLFYNVNVPMTLNATETGFELYMRRFHNLPVLFDETALISDSKLQERIFKIAGGMGKLRGTKDLSVDITFLKSVVFITGEVDPQFERRGAERRYIIVPVNSWEDYTGKVKPSELHQLMKVACGCAFDYIKFLEEEGDVEIKIKLDERFQIFTFTPLIEKSLNFLKRFYNLSKWEVMNLEESLNALMSYQLEKLDLSIEKFLSSFMEFLLSRAPHFVIRNSLSQQVPKNLVFGEIDPVEEKVYITRECLENFKEFVKLDLKTILKFFEEASVVSVFYVEDGGKMVKRYTKARRIKYMDAEMTVSVYEFDLKRISESFLKELTGAVMKSKESVQSVGQGGVNQQIGAYQLEVQSGAKQSAVYERAGEKIELRREINIPTPFDDDFPF